MRCQIVILLLYPQISHRLIADTDCVLIRCLDGHGLLCLAHFNSYLFIYFGIRICSSSSGSFSEYFVCLPIWKKVLWVFSYSVIYGGKVLTPWRPECRLTQYIVILCKTVALRLCAAFGNSISQCITWLHFECKFGERMALYFIVYVNITPWGVPATRHRLITTNSPEETKENTPVNLSVNVRAYYKHVRKQMNRCKKPGSIANWGRPASSQWPVTWLPGVQLREGQLEDFLMPSGLWDSLLSAADVTYFCVGSTVPVLGFTLGGPVPCVMAPA